MGRKFASVMDKIFLWLITLLFLAGCFALITKSTGGKTNAGSQFTVTLRALIPQADTYQLFYDTGAGFNENDSIRTAVASSPDYQDIVFALPDAVNEIKTLRLDFGSSPDVQISIEQVSLSKGYGKYTWDAAAILKQFVLYNQLSVSGEGDTVMVATKGGDPFFYCNSIDQATASLAGAKGGNSLAWLILICPVLLGLRYLLKKAASRGIRLTDRLIVAAFFLILFVPFLTAVLGIKVNAGNTEKRTLASKPPLEFTMPSVQAFPQKFESYFNDSFPFRDFFIKNYNLLNVNYIKESPVKTVVMGKGRWLFYAGEKTMEDVKGEIPFTPEQLEKLRVNLEQQRDWLKKQGIDYYVMVAPNKESIYSEYLPNSIQKGPQSRLDQLEEYLAQHSDFKLMDVRQTIISGKSQERKYHYTDTHWNQSGAYDAYRQLMGEISEKWPELKPIPRDQYELKSTPGNGGDLANMLAMTDIIQEDWIDYVPKFTPKSKLVGFRDDPYIYSEIPGSSLPRGVIFRDSFGNPLQPYISEHFSRLAFVWKHNFDADIILQEKPQIVIHEVVERMLETLLADNPPQLAQ